MVLTGKQMGAVLGAGINLGQRFESKQQSRDPAVIKPLIKAYRQQGFKHLRIPVTWYPDGKSCMLDDTVFMANLMEVVRYAIKELGFIVILNAHSEQWLFSAWKDESVIRAKWWSLWKRIATTFQAYSQSELIFEALNEPTGLLHDNAELTRLANRVAYDGVRFVDRDRIVMLQPQQMGHISAVAKTYPDTASLPMQGADPYLMIQAHSYDGWSWCSPDSKLTTYSMTDSIRSMFTAAATHVRTKLPSTCLHLGECGVGRRSASLRNTDAMRKYYHDVAALCTQLHIPPCAWCDGPGSWFALIDSHNHMLYGLPQSFLNGF